MTEAMRQRTLRGVEGSPPTRVELTAGPVRAVLDGVDLREVRLSGSSRALIDRVYVAVRDRDWGTVPAVVSGLVVRPSEDGFSATFSASHRSADVAFDWQGRIDGHPDGRLVYAMTGAAAGAFDYCRIGFCVLHPDALAGAAYSARTPDGQVSGHLPELITPQTIIDGVEQALFPVFDELVITTKEGVAVETVFTGDLFETEDQRNWTDASFKTYGTPIALGYPHRAEPGQVFAQSVTIRVVPSGGREPVAGPTEPGDVTTIRLGKESGRSFPSVGLGMASDGEPLTNREVALLRALRLDHLRVDVRPSQAGWDRRLDEAVRQAEQLECALELALFVPATGSEGEPPGAVAGRRVAERIADARLARVIVFDEGSAATGVTPVGLVADVRAGLGERGRATPIVGGTDGDFAELNRARTGLDGLDGLAYAVNPQVHASDDRSILENVTAQGASVATARSFAGGRSICVGPVTLSPRFNPAAAEPGATGDTDVTSAGRLPRAVDPRQVSLLAAAWTVGSMAALAGADAVTWYETVGWRGLIERAAGSPLPERFLSVPGMTFPMYHAFADLAEMREGVLLDVASSSPRALTGLAVRRGDRVNALLANLTPGELTIAVGPVGPEVRYRLLDESTAALASGDPEAFRRSGAAEPSVDGWLRLTLRPYAVLVLGADAVPTT